MANHKEINRRHFLKTAAATTAFNPDLVSTAVSDPTKITGDKDQLTSFLDQWNAAYRGPASLESTSGYGDVAKAAQGAGSRAGQLESTGGRQQLIQDEFGVYGQGNKGLDEALLQQSSFFPKVQEQGKEFRSIQDYLASQSKGISAQAREAKAATDAVSLG